MSHIFFPPSRSSLDIFFSSFYLVPLLFFPWLESPHAIFSATTLYLLHGRGMTHPPSRSSPAVFFLPTTTTSTSYMTSISLSRLGGCCSGGYSSRRTCLHLHSWHISLMYLFSTTSAVTYSRLPVNTATYKLQASSFLLCSSSFKIHTLGAESNDSSTSTV